MYRKLTVLVLSFFLIFSVILIVPTQVAALPKITDVKVTTSFTLVTGRANISYKCSENCTAKVDILDRVGTVVRRLPSKPATAGVAVLFIWDGRNNAGNYVSAGIYQVKMYAGTTILTNSTQALAPASQSLTNVSVPASLTQPASAIFKYQLSAKNDVLISIYNVSNIKVSSYVFRDVTPNVLQSYTWDGKATITTVDQPAGSLVKPGQYRVRISSYNAYADQYIKVYARLSAPASPSLSFGSTVYKASWGAVSNASNYEIKLYKNAVLMTTFLTGNVTVYNLTTQIKNYGSGSYKFSIRAIGSGYYLSSLSTLSPTVSYVQATGLTIVPNISYLNKGATVTLTATIIPSDATNKTLSWSSSNTAVATVNASGVVTAVAAGQANIAVNSNDNPSLVKYCTIRVSEPGVSIPDGTYLLKLQSATRYMFVVGSAPASGSNVATEATLSNDLTQRFHFENIGSNRYNIRSIWSSNGMVLNQATTSSTPVAGTNINLYPASTAAYSRQTWMLTKRWDGSYTISPVTSINFALSYSGGNVILGPYTPTNGAYVTAAHWQLLSTLTSINPTNTSMWPLGPEPAINNGQWHWPMLSAKYVSGSAVIDSLRYSTVKIAVPTSGYNETGLIATAARSGYIVWINSTRSSIIIKSVIGSATYFTSYGNMIKNSIPTWMTIGSYVYEGYVIGRVGSSASSSTTAHLDYGLKVGGEFNTATGTPVYPLSIGYWNAANLVPHVSISSYSSASQITVVSNSLTSDSSKLYLTMTIIARSSSSDDDPNAIVSKILYQRKKINAGYTTITIDKTGMAAKSSYQSYYLLIELENLANGCSHATYVALK